MNFDTEYTDDLDPPEEEGGRRRSYVDAVRGLVPVPNNIESLAAAIYTITHHPLSEMDKAVRTIATADSTDDWQNTPVYESWRHTVLTRWSNAISGRAIISPEEREEHESIVKKYAHSRKMLPHGFPRALPPSRELTESDRLFEMFHILVSLSDESAIGGVPETLPDKSKADMRHAAMEGINLIYEYGLGKFEDPKKWDEGARVMQWVDDAFGSSEAFIKRFEAQRVRPRPAGRQV